MTPTIGGHPTHSGRTVPDAYPVVLPSRTISIDGRLTVTGLGQHIDVDAGRLTEINVSAFARWGFGLARFHWPGGGFWMWQRLAYLPNPRRRFSESGASQNVSESFRDLVYRLHLINPAMRIHGVAPPPWALRNPTPNHPHPTDQQHL